jgi:hypothetical protein
MRFIGILGITLGGMSVIGAVTAYGEMKTRSHYEGPTAGVVNETGNLRVPADYRTAYQLLGTWAVAKDDGAGSKQLHVVYASPGAIAGYRKSGHFPDGTVLVKEVFNTTTKGMTTGTVSSAGALAGWFVMVKDSAGHFQETSCGATAGAGPGSTRRMPGRPRPPTTKRTVEPVMCRHNRQTGSTRTATRS